MTKGKIKAGIATRIHLHFLTVLKRRRRRQQSKFSKISLRFCKRCCIQHPCIAKWWWSRWILASREQNGTRADKTWWLAVANINGDEKIMLNSMHRRMFAFARECPFTCLSLLLLYYSLRILRAKFHILCTPIYIYKYSRHALNIRYFQRQINALDILTIFISNLKYRKSIQRKWRRKNKVLQKEEFW